MNKIDIPNYTEEIFSKKKNDYALVIPVINEGDKIRDQLKRVKLSNLNIDVIIADGGSSDGSLDSKYLQEQEVRAILIKNDIGKLSSQLRIAYFWALKEGYNGIITIDGNGKDDVSYVSKIKNKLMQGYDYIQGSRYVSGGISKNTPIDRKIANQFIHAPLISLSTGFKFTDTTNGFRGYSSKFLQDNNVQPFRNIFCNYELLFYLSVRACKLNFRICEVPVSRIYPKEGAIPTKIRGFKAKFDILKETILVIVGFYNPKKIKIKLHT